MRNRAFPILALLASASFGLPPAEAWAQEEPSADAVIATFEKLSGVHAGLRRNHAKGLCASGSFQASADAGALSASTLFSGQSVPVTARFSVSGPDPAVADTLKNPIGMALQFQLPGGELQNMTMIQVPVFLAAKPADFLELLQAQVPDPATGKTDPEKLKTYVANHPEFKNFAGWMATHNPPASYAETAFYSVHAFKFVDSGKKAQWVKWRFEPRDGEKFISDEEMTTLPKDFLAARLSERAQKGPILWDMVVVLGEKDDPIDNPTIPWPANRREIKAGTLTLTKVGEDAAGQCEDINYDPNLVSAGIETSPDPILAFRSSAYAVSYGKRLDEKAK
ncbi:catalase family peroxidase [Rhodoblastus sp.]|uniref:catalase family peroxidase n=1 Tax=Rhodoblastus sp. TaxID=1962975 RepID=UPI003F98C5FC